MGISFIIWWWYVDGAAGASEQPVRTTREAIRFHIWSYAHFPLYLGTVVAGAGVQRIVTAASHSWLTPGDAAMLAGGVGTVMIAMTLVGATSANSGRWHAASLAPHVSLACATIALGIVGHRIAPVVMIVGLAGLCAGQLSWSLVDRGDASRRARRKAIRDSCKSVGSEAAVASRRMRGVSR